MVDAARLLDRSIGRVTQPQTAARTCTARQQFTQSDRNSMVIMLLTEG